MADERVDRLADFRLPSLGADMDEARMIEWRVKPGDAVNRGDVVALIDTEKSEIDLEIWHGGVIEELVVHEGELVPVGTVLARIRTAEGAVETAPTATLTSTTAPRILSPLVRHLAEDRHVDLTRIIGSGPGGRVWRQDVEEERPRPSRSSAVSSRGPGVLASPRARRLAAELRVDLDRVRGSGPGGAIVAADVEAHRVPDADLATDGRDLRQVRDARGSVRGPRHAIAEIMARSNRDVPHYYLACDIDCSEVMAALAAYNADRPARERILGAAVLLLGVARAARTHPELNGFWEDGDFRAGSGVHLGVAVARRGGGLVAPAIRGADSLDLPAMMANLADLVARTRAGRVRSSEMESPTITVTNLGERGATLVLPVIYPPQVAMVGFGAILPRPWVVDGDVVVRTVVTATLAGDHRATDGDRGARFLATLAHEIQSMKIVDGVRLTEGTT